MKNTCGSGTKRSNCQKFIVKPVNLLEEKERETWKKENANKNEWIPWHTHAEPEWKKREVSP